MITTNQIKIGLKFKVDGNNTYVIKNISNKQELYIINVRYENLRTNLPPFEWLSKSSFVDLVNNDPVKWKILNLPNKLEYIEEL